ncbi:hypothetical protein JCM10212_005356 [Sporobolomyces blumeae]
MPELPEVEAARSRLERAAVGKTIESVVTNDDPIVYSGCTHATFATAIQGKTVKAVRRLGKNFYMVLDDSTAHPIFHFGMSGMAHVRGTPSPVYRVPRTKSDEEWPPKYMKCLIVFRGGGVRADDRNEWAFCDPRRLGRIKIVECREDEVEKVKPLSELGADPLLNMPPLQELGQALLRRHAPIKAVLLDQYGPLCGIGNYMVDEILYQSAIHPAHPASTLSPSSLSTLHAQIVNVTNTAVRADADASRFPSDWLFQYRWSKGKKGRGDFVLPDGTTSTISFVTVGGRTSAVVDRVQVLPDDVADSLKSKGAARRRGKRKAREESDGAEDQDDDDAAGHDLEGNVDGTDTKPTRSKGAEKKTKVGGLRTPGDELEAEKLEAVQFDDSREHPSNGDMITSPHFRKARSSKTINYREVDADDDDQT